MLSPGALTLATCTLAYANWTEGCINKLDSSKITQRLRRFPMESNDEQNLLRMASNLLAITL